MPQTIISEDHHPTLRHADRRAIGAELEVILITLTDLSLAGKPMRWRSAPWRLATRPMAAPARSPSGRS
jgi:hypothetical protein